MTGLYHFSLDFKPDIGGLPFFARFPFIFDGAPLSEIFCGISSRFAGDMKYSQINPARLTLFDKLGLGCVYGLSQIHSRSVLKVDRNNPPLESADGMVTKDREAVLSVTVADCLPVFLLDTDSGAFGLVHSGWKGTGIVLEALRLMREQWVSRPEAVAAILGPCIDSCCYNVDEQRAKIFENEYGPESVRKSGEDFYLDLKSANTRLLTEAGVRNIAVCDCCTFTDERLGSFRREGAENYTRMLALVGYEATQ
ncbi:MAG: polyphenol oxidase family protein [Treponema sp.]|nr:polyphenol oxidase family protein [Treponema sp.]